MTTAVVPLGQRLPADGTRDADTVLEIFLAWVADTGLSPYPEQEEAILELLSGHHVVLSTPTGSGKSLVALALHWKGLCEGKRSIYTAPVKALVSEKFFALCEDFGAENVGMLTGDASVNRNAPIICCTTEVLSNMALRQGEALDAPYAVLDEFHYYGDRERGLAWQIPLISLPQTTFLLMSATIGNTAQIEERLEADTQREVTHVHSDVRPVPLEFTYRETPLHETLELLIERGLAPVYVVSFTQRECGELAQGLTSSAFLEKEERKALAREIADSRFDSPYGKDLKRFLSHGIGVHHAGLLPRYRLVVEKLAQTGMLKVICGTDTLGVGVNIPIRSVLFTKLSKYDGEKVRVLSVRDFKQIAGRAGRKGFDDFGDVVCQAPEHVIENKRLAARAEKKGSKRVARKKPPQGFVGWTQQTFEQLIEKAPEPMRSRLDITHGMIVSLLQREDTQKETGYRAVVRLIERSHETPAGKSRLRRRAAERFRSLRAAGIIDIIDSGFGAPEARVQGSLQTDFSLHNTLSLYLVEAARGLDIESPSYAIELLTLVESIQENPRVILQAQIHRAKGELIAELKAQGVDYDDRQRKLEDVTYPRPDEAFIRETFRIFAEAHPWVAEENVRPKSIARELFEGMHGFADYVKDYNLARSEGILLRYLSQVHNTLAKSIPESAKTEGVYDVLGFLRTLLTRVDSSLVEAWESLSDPSHTDVRAEADASAPLLDLAANERALRARVRQEMLALVAALARKEYSEAARYLRDPDEQSTPHRLEEAIGPYFEEYAQILLTPEARRAHHSRIVRVDDRRFDVTQVLLDPAGDHLWAIHGEVDLRAERDPDHPLVRLIRIGP